MNPSNEKDEIQDDEIDVPGVNVALPLLSVLIVRDPMVQIPHECYAHELPILQLREGEENVTITGEKEVVVTNFSVESEYDRLSRKYAQSPEAFHAVYGQNPGRLANELDMPYKPMLGARRVRKLPMARIIDHATGEDNDAGQSKSEVIRGKAAEEMLAGADKAGEGNITKDAKTGAAANKGGGKKKPGKAA